MDQQIQNFIDGKRIAVVGVSRDSKKFGSMAYKELKQHRSGCTMYGSSSRPIRPES